jgi:hypothetical protein
VRKGERIDGAQPGDEVVAGLRAVALDRELGVAFFFEFHVGVVAGGDIDDACVAAFLLQLMYLLYEGLPMNAAL